MQNQLKNQTSPYLLQHAENSVGWFQAMFGSCFYGWYLKCQSDTKTLAIIPAVHQTGKKRTCSIQVITDEGAWTVDFPTIMFRRRGKHIMIGRNRFGTRGIRMAVHTPELNMRVWLDFGALTPLKYDIMGPFSIVPFLECRHSVYSMWHTVNGMAYINGQKYSFQNALGYWEGDRGHSFPKEYAWTQCSFPEGALMLSVADIPIAGIHFTGIIAVVLWKGREYRLATYLGARAVQIHNKTIRIVQGRLCLEAKLLEDNSHPLKAPNRGDMVRTILEGAASKAAYRFSKGRDIIFSVETDRASFEYEYPV